MADDFEKRMLRAKVREYLTGKYRTAAVKKVLRILDGFPTADAFCTASKGMWLAKYREARPTSSFDIGKLCENAIEDAITFIREDRWNAKFNRQIAEREKHEAEEEAKRKDEEEEKRRNPKFTLAELKSLTAFMDLCDIAAIDLKGIKSFLTLVDAKVKE